MTDSLKALDTKIENKSTFALTILVSTSLLCVAYLVSGDNISLKMVLDETRSNKNVLLLLNVSLISCVLGWFLYFLIALSTESLISEISHNKYTLTLMLSSLTILQKKAFRFSAISISDDMMLLFSTSVMFSFAFTFLEKGI